MPEAETEDDDNIPHHFRYYDKKKRVYWGLFQVYKKEDGFYYFPCLPGYSKENDSCGPFDSIESARDEALSD